MKVYAFDLVPWPYLEEPSYYPDANALYDPARGREVYAQHLDQMALYEEYGFDAVCINEHHAKPYGLMPSPNIIAAALTQRTRRIKIGILHEFDFDLTQREGITLVGDPDYLVREIRAQMRLLGAGVLMGLFQFGSLPHALAVKNIELFARAVLPELRRE